MSYSQLPNPQEPQIAGFVSKTFEILKNQEFCKIAYWSQNGKEFVIRDITKFQQIVLPKYFRHKKINSFIRQLNMYGFHKSRKQNTKSIFSHPGFLRGREDLLSSIKRKIKIPENQPSTPTKIEKPSVDDNQTSAKTASTPCVLKEQSPGSGCDINIREFLESKQCLQSRMNLTFNCYASLNKLSQSCFGGIIGDYSDRDQCISIENGIVEQQDQNFNDNQEFKVEKGERDESCQMQSNREIKFQTPSYFVLPNREPQGNYF